MRRICSGNEGVQASSLSFDISGSIAASEAAVLLLALGETELVADEASQTVGRPWVGG